MVQKLDHFSVLRQNDQLTVVYLATGQGVRMEKAWASTISDQEISPGLAPPPQGYSNHYDDGKTIRGTQYKPIRDKNGCMSKFLLMSQFRMRYPIAGCIRKPSQGFVHKPFVF